MRQFMAPSIPFPNPDHIKTKILTESVTLFALRGYGVVTIRDIAGASNVPPAAVYQRFPDKQSIMESIMQFTEQELLSYYGVMDRLSEEAESFPEIVRNLFQESQEVVNPFAFYSIYCAMTSQFLLECCRHVYYDVYFVEGHVVMRRQLETAIRRGLVKPFDVGEVAMTITNCFVAMISLNVGRITGHFEDFDPNEWYERQIRHILRITGDGPCPLCPSPIKTEG